MGCTQCAKELGQSFDGLPRARHSHAPIDDDIQWIRETLHPRDTDSDVRKSLPTDFSKILTDSLLDPSTRQSSDPAVERLSQQVKDLETYKGLYFQEMQELQKLRSAVAVLQTTLEHSVGNIGKLEADLMQRRAKEEALRLENEEIKKRMEVIESSAVPVGRCTPFSTAESERDKLDKVLKTHIFQRLGNTVGRMLSDSMHSWHLRTIELKNEENAYSPPSLHLSSVSELDYSLMEKDDLTRSNPLVLAIRKQGETWTSIMPKTRLLRLFEDTLSAKYDTDVQDLACRREVRLLSEFMADYLIRKFGLLKLAMHELSQFVPGLFKLYQENHPYGVVMARLLGLFHPEPISKEIAAYITKAKVEFAGQCEVLRKERQGTSKVTCLTPKSGSRSAEFVENGGFVQLSDVLTALYKAFEGHKALGAFAVALLKPETLTQEEYICFLLCHKVATTGKRPEELFRFLDTRNSGQVAATVLVAGLCESLDLWVSAEDVLLLLKTSWLNLKEFLRTINYERYFGYALSTDLQVSGQTYVRVLVDVYDHMVALQTEAISDVFFDVAAADEMTKLELAKAVTKIDPQMSPVQVKQLLNTQENSLSLYEFQRLVLENKVGGMGVGPFKLQQGETVPLRTLIEKNSLLSPEAKTRKNVEFEGGGKPRLSGKQPRKARRAI